MTEFDTAVTIHAAHYAARLEDLSQWFEGDAEKHGLRQLIGQRVFSLEQGNVLGLLDAAEERRHAGWLNTLANHLWLPLEVECEFRLMRECGERLLALASEVQGNEYRCACLLLLAHAWRTLGKYKETLSCVQEILNSSDARTSSMYPDAKCIEGVVLSRSGNNAGAVAALEGARSAYQERNEPINAAHAMVRHASAAYNLGQHEGVIEEVRQAVELFRDAGNVRRRAAALLSLAYLLIRMQRTAEAEEALGPALEMKRLLSDKAGIGNCLLNLACCQMSRHSYEEARVTCTEALQVLTDLGMTQEAAAARLNLAMICYPQEEFAEAEGHLQVALDLFQRGQNKGGQATASRMLAMLSLGHGDLDQAARRLNQSYRLAAELQNIREEALCAALTGALLVRRGEYAAGEQLLEAALSEADQKQLGFEDDIQQIIAKARATIAEGRAFAADDQAHGPDVFEELQPRGTWRETLEAALGRG
jgi:tetratricopeptide (TPR) repeat protein